MKRQAPYAELALPVLFLTVTVWYLVDSYRASATIENLLLILPTSVVVLTLCAWIALRTLVLTPSRQEEEALLEEEKPKEKKVSVLGAMIILAAYVLSMGFIGFDVATFLFIAALMFLQGERRIGWLIGFSLIFAFLVSLFFQYMIPYPMPMLLGKEFIGRLL